MAVVWQTNSCCITGHLQDAVVSSFRKVMSFLKLTANCLILNEYEVTVPSAVALRLVTVTSVS